MSIFAKARFTLQSQSRWAMSTAVRRSDARSDFNSQNKQQHKKQQSLQHNLNNNQQHNHHNHYQWHHVPVLCALGLFGGAKADDIEEEKAKLTDEQKIKKMTPTELLIAKGVSLLCDQDHDKAIELFHKALYKSQEEKNEDQETLVLNLIATSYFESGDLEKAEKLFIDLIKRMIACEIEPTDNAILEFSLKLASIYSKDRSTHEKALKGFKFVIESLLFKLKDTLNNFDAHEIQELSEEKKNELALLGWSYDWFARHLLAVNDFNGAASMLQKAVDISSRVLGPLHDQTLTLLNDVGTTLAMNNAPEKGKTFIQKAVEGAIESQSKEIASFYVNLGLVNLRLKQLSDAKRYCEFAIELASKNREHYNSDEVMRLSRYCLKEVEQLLNLVENQ